MRWLAVAVGAWLAVSYFAGAGRVPAPVVSNTPQSVEGCHCLIEPNHGLYR